MRLAALLPGVLALLACAQNETAIYARAETDLRRAGYLRTDPSPPDAAYTDADLLRNFERIAFYSEFAREGGRFVKKSRETVLSKWTAPIRIRIIFGASVSAEQRLRDRKSVSGFTGRLSRLTGLPITLAGPDQRANFIVIYANSEERTVFAGEIARSNPQADPAFIDSLRNSPRSEVCFVNTFWRSDQPGRTSFAVTVIKAEARGLMRLSCVHEELTQSLGLSNDDPRVRPSIFNDDEEFALLTSHDEMLLRMLYHPRLRPGMLASAVRPLLPGILADLKDAQ